MRLHTAAGAAGLLALAAAPVVDTLRYGPAEGTTLTKTFTTSIEFSLDDLLINFNGQEIDPGMMGADLDEANGSVELVVEVLDEYGAPGKGRPAQLTRTFNTLSVDYEMGSGDSGSESGDDIEGKTIVFTLDEDSGEYELSSPDEEVDLDDAKMLAEDMDHRALLPGKDVETGDTWKVSGMALVSVLAPGIDMGKAMAKAREEMADEEVPFDFESITDGIVEGTAITCTYAGLRDVDGRELQVVELAGEMDQAIDLTEMLLEVIRANAPAEVDMDLTANLELAGELEGEALWDSETGTLRACEWTLELILVGSGDVDADAGGQDVQGSAELEVSANVSRQVTVN